MRTLKQARSDKGIKQVAVANAIGITRQTYAKYEKDPSLMTVAQAMAACSFIGVKMEDVFFGQEGKFN